jgi:hypothetical protein
MTTPPSHDEKASFVIFHDAKGKVFHVHKHVSFSGKHASDDDVEANARALLEKLGRSRAGMRSLLVKDLELDPGKQYRVDVARCKLVASTRR